VLKEWSIKGFFESLLGLINELDLFDLIGDDKLSSLILLSKSNNVGLCSLTYFSFFNRKEKHGIEGSKISDDVEGELDNKEDVENLEGFKKRGESNDEDIEEDIEEKEDKGEEKGEAEGFLEIGVNLLILLDEEMNISTFLILYVIMILYVN
jgi:hypothetical protein